MFCGKENDCFIQQGFNVNVNFLEKYLSFLKETYDVLAKTSMFCDVFVEILMFYLFSEFFNDYF